MGGWKWAYGITTVPERELGYSFSNSTLLSLVNGGFTSPSIFLDYPNEYSSNSRRRGIVGNWFLSAWELFIKNPDADIYAIFQDDILCSRNIRPYLEKAYPNLPNLDNVYLNLYTSGSNYYVNEKGEFIGGLEYMSRESNLSVTKTGFYISNQLGKGALALVFPTKVFQRLLVSPQFLTKFKEPSSRSHKAVDGCICDAFRKEFLLSPTPISRVMEYVHNPSLVQHRLLDSTTHANVNPSKRVSPCFMGEEFDCLTLLESRDIQKPFCNS